MREHRRSRSYAIRRETVDLSGHTPPTERDSLGRRKRPNPFDVIDGLVEAEGRPTLSFDELSAAWMSTEQAERDLLPLLMFKGPWGVGRAQALWNFAQTAKAQEIETMADIGRFAATEDDVVHAAGFHAPPSDRAIGALTNRINSQGAVQRLDPALWDYLRAVAARSHRWILNYKPIAPTSRRARVAWRYVEPEPRQCATCGYEFTPFGPQKYCSADCRPSFTVAVQLPAVQIGASWPFVAQADPAPTDGLDMLMAVDQIVTRNMPESTRQDVCQDVVLALLEGDITMAELQRRRGEYLTTIIRRHRLKYGVLSIDAPPPWDPSGRTLAEILTAN